MTNFGLIDIQFEYDFREFEKMRMYPLGYGKESAMTKFTMEHIDALVRAETSYLKAYDNTAPAIARKQFDDDLLRLETIKRLLMQIMYQPGLPVTNFDPVEEPERGPANNGS